MHAMTMSSSMRHSGDGGGGAGGGGGGGGSLILARPNKPGHVHPAAVTMMWARLPAASTSPSCWLPSIPKTFPSLSRSGGENFSLLRWRPSSCACCSWPGLAEVREGVSLDGRLSFAHIKGPSSKKTGRAQYLAVEAGALPTVPASSTVSSCLAAGFSLIGQASGRLAAVVKSGPGFGPLLLDGSHGRLRDNSFALAEFGFDLADAAQPPAQGPRSQYQRRRQHLGQDHPA